MSDRNPRFDDNDVPWCSEDDCPLFDGKRCEELGQRPGGICEPAVIDLAASISRVRALVESVRAPTANHYSRALTVEELDEAIEGPYED